MARFILAVSLQNRAGNVDKDARVVNAFIEAGGDAATGARLRAVKRPAFDSAYTTVTGQGQGLFTWNTPGPLGPEQALVAISDDTLAYGSSINTLTKALRFVTQPATPQNISTAITPSVTVEAISKAGNRVTSFTSNVVASLSTNPTGATLGGTVTKAAVAGLATFNDLTLNRSGSGFKLTATSSTIRSATSSAFAIPTALVFTQQPASGQPNVTLDPIEVTAEDSDGNVDANFTGNVTISLFSNPAGGVLSGTTTVAAVAGIATFSNLQIDENGTYTLKAFCNDASDNLVTSYKPASIVSGSFSIGGVITAASLVTGPSQAYGYNSDASLGAVGGSISPSTFNGVNIVGLTSNVTPVNAIVLAMAGNVAQNFFTTLTLNGTAVTGVGATSYGYDGGLNVTIWIWSVSPPIVSPGSYGVSVV